jgi:hypothetical protein
MTDLYRIRPDVHGCVGTIHATQGDANQDAAAQRKEGVSTVLEKLTLKKLPKKELLCWLANRVPDGDENSPFETITEIKKVAGVKKPKAKDGGA